MVYPTSSSLSRSYSLTRYSLFSQSLSLPCSLECFFQTFLADDVEHSLTRYQSECIQDRDVTASPWEKNAIMSSRMITFTHPIKSVAMVLGPSEARTKRHQRLWRFEKGILLENITHIEGIPNADTFCICDRWVIVAESNDSGGVQLSSSFELQFTKRSLFRNLIEKSVKRETFEWWSGYTKMVQDVLLKTALPLPPAPSATILLEGSSQILKRLDQQYKWTIRLLFFVIFLLISLVLLLIALITIFTSEVRLLRATLLPMKKLVSSTPEYVYVEEL